MSAAVIENAIHREQSPADIVSIKLDEAHICGDVECRTISNSDDVCPGCCGKTFTLANIVENPINSLAHEIADGESKIIIWSFSTFEMIDGVCWYLNYAWPGHTAGGRLVGQRCFAISLSI